MSLQAPSSKPMVLFYASSGFMEDFLNQIPPDPDLTQAQHQRVQAARDFLSICDGSGRPASIERLR